MEYMKAHEKRKKLMDSNLGEEIKVVNKSVKTNVYEIVTRCDGYRTLEMT